MFVADKLVYVQMEKTASTHIARVLADVVGGEQQVQHIHLTRADLDGTLPIDPSGRLVVASIRNPWSWYLSLWAYGCGGGGGRFGAYHRLTADPPTLGELIRRSVRYSRAKRRLPVEVVRDTRAERARQRNVRTDLWRPLYRDATDTEAFRAWLRLVFTPERAQELFPEFGRTTLRFHSSYMTFRYLWNFFGRDRARLQDPDTVDTTDQIRQFERSRSLVDDVIVVERLEPELRRVLDEAGYELTPVQEARLSELCAERTNESPHRQEREYFDDETAALVATRDRFLIERFKLEEPW